MKELAGHEKFDQPQIKPSLVRSKDAYVPISLPELSILSASFQGVPQYFEVPLNIEVRRIILFS